MQTIPRMNLHLRIQHGALLLSVATALVTGIGGARGLSLLLGVDFATWQLLRTSSRTPCPPAAIREDLRSWSSTWPGERVTSVRWRS